MAKKRPKKKIRMRRNIKDSVFTFLFGQKEYAFELYQALHPEDAESVIDDLRIITLKNIISAGMYNDLGLRIRNRLIVLCEAQSTFSKLIALRALPYLSNTYMEYVDEQKVDLYGIKEVKIPRPEMYVVYTGSKKDVPDAVRLSGLYDGEPKDAEIIVRVIRMRGENDIIDQYIKFCQIADEQRKLYGYSQKAIEETIRLCTEQGILVQFLLSRRKEIFRIMDSLFDQRRAMEIHDYHVRKESWEEGREEGREEGISALVQTLQEMGTELTVVESAVIKRFSLAPELAVKKVKAYWNSNV